MLDMYVETRMPADFVSVEKEIFVIKTDMRYLNGNNFVGRKIKGYEANVCLLTKAATESLKKVVDILYPLGLTLKIYDCYRPQTAVNDFVSWSMETGDDAMKSVFYPNVKKSDLFKQGYIAEKSSHSRGSTVDLTIVAVEKDNHSTKIDFGKGFDYFDPQSSPSYQYISPQVKANRLLLNLLMTSVGFKGYDKEWWHFTLCDEPYPTTYFDFPVNFLDKNK